MNRLVRRLARVPTPLIFLVSVLGAVVLLWREGSLASVAEAAQGVDPAVAVVAYALYVLGLAVLCFRWHLLVLMTKGESNVPRASEAFLTSVVINYAAPVGLAVPTRAALTKRALGLSVRETGAVAFWEIVSDVLVLGSGTVLWLLTVSGGSSAIASPLGDNNMLVVLAMLLSLAVVGGIVWKSRRLRSRIQKLASGALQYPRAHPAVAGAVVAVTVGYWVIQGVVLGLLLGAVDASATVGFVLGLISMPVLVGMLSPVPGGAGVREALMVAVADVHGADPAAVLVSAVTYRVALFVAIPVLYIVVRSWLRLPGAGADEPTGRDG
jgi:uncharacterized membrane protein YbhN (UPF0104 family)